MTLNKQIVAGVALALVALSAQAEWKGKGEAGLVYASGNTDASTLNLKLSMSTVVDQWKHTLEMAALRAKTSGITSADRYMVGWQSDYTINPRTFWFNGLRYEHDALSGFNYQATASTGLGYKFYDTDKMKLSGQVGVGYRRISTNSVYLPSYVPSKTSGDAVLVGGFDYLNVLSDTTKLVDKFHFEAGSKDVLLSNFIGVEVKMSSALALSVGLDLRDNTKPPAGKKKIDTISTVNLVYAF